MAIVIPGERDVRGTLDTPDGTNEDDRFERLVVACPPHPQQGGTRSDQRLLAVSDALCENGIACLRFDYGTWDEGRGEQEDAKHAIEWARERADRVGLFGFSFGATMALCAAADIENLWAVCVLAPDRGEEGSDAVAALDGIKHPVKILYAERDSTADWKPVVERAREIGVAVEGLSADHFFLGQAEKVAARVQEFFEND